MGAFYCLASAVGFGMMALFAKSAYDEGVSTASLLLVRFAIAAAVLLAAARMSGALRGLSRRAVVVGLAMGALGYAAQATLYFTALRHLDASLVALVFYVYPVLVMLVAVATRREEPSVRRTAALVVALGGVVLVLAGAASGSFDLFGVALALASAVMYTGYITVGDRVGAVAPPVALAALVCAGAATALLAAGVVQGGPDVTFTLTGWAWLLALALIGTVGAILLFFAGLARVGPSTAAILSIVEPLVTVLSVAWAFGERLTAIQWLGTALVLGAVILVQVPARRTEPVVVPT